MKQRYEALKLWIPNKQISLLSLAIFVIGIWSLSLYANRILRDDMQRLMGERQFSTTTIIAADINDELKDRLKVLEKTAARITPAIFGNTPAIQQFLEDSATIEVMFNAGCIITKDDGIAVASLPLSAGRVGLNYMDRSFVAAALKEGKSFIGKPYIGKALKSPIIGMAVPIRDDKGKVIGALVGVTYLNKPNFLDKITEYSYGKTGGYQIVARQQRQIIAATDKKHIMEVLPPPGVVNPFIEGALQGYEGSGTAITPSGLEVLAATKGIPVADWYVATLLPTAEAFAPIRTMQQRLVLASTILTLLAICFTWWSVKVRQANKLLEEIAEKQTAKSLESEERFRSLVENINDVLFVLTPEGIFNYVSPQWKEAFGYELSETIAQPFKQFVHPDDLPGCLTFLQQAMETVEKQEGFEYRVICKDGTYLWYRANASIINDPAEGKLLVGIGRDITDVKLAMDTIQQFNISLENTVNERTLELQEERQRLSDIIRGTNAGTWEWNVQTGETSFNERWAEMIGYTLEEISPVSIETWMHFAHPEDLKASGELLEKHFRGELDYYEFESRLKHKSGNWIWVVGRGKVTTWSDNGKPLMMMGIHQVITKRKLAEYALKVRVKELDCLYNTINLMSFPSVSFEEILAKAVLLIPSGWQFSEIAEARIVINENYYQTPRFRETPWMLTREILKDEKPIGQVEVCYLEEQLSEDEGPFIIEEINLLNAIAEKLSLASELRDAARELQESVIRYDRLAEQSGTMIWEVDANGLYTFVNHVSKAVFGYRPKEMIGLMHFFDVFPESERDAIKKRVAPIFKNKQNVINFENKTITKDGRQLWWTTNAIPILSEDGTLLGYRGSDTDITEKKNLSEQLIHSQKMESIGKLAGGLAHDLNNILTVINGYATMLKFSIPQHEEPQQILKATTRAASLTHALLAYSRKQSMQQSNQNLNLLIADVGAFIKRILHDNIEFTLSLANDPLFVFADKVQIEQVMLNFTTNARDAMPRGGTFSIATSAGRIDEGYIATHGFGEIGSYAIITVSDTGHGMDAETVLKVFDPFFTTKEVGKGTGLGLSMVFGIVRQHGGFIDLQSEPGKGSVFRIYLPLVDAEMVEDGPVENDELMEAASGTTLLLAEDDPITLLMMAEFLKKAGYTVVTAVDGQDAVEKFAAHKDEIKLVISDVIMPRKSGKTACDEIREMVKTTKFIFVTGHSRAEFGHEDTPDTDDVMMIKPLLPFELLSKIRELLTTIA